MRRPVCSQAGRSVGNVVPPPPSQDKPGAWWISGVCWHHLAAFVCRAGDGATVAFGDLVPGGRLQMSETMMDNSRGATCFLLLAAGSCMYQLDQTRF